MVGQGEIIFILLVGLQEEQNHVGKKTNHIVVLFIFFIASFLFFAIN